jgi:hypothetical protein
MVEGSWSAYPARPCRGQHCTGSTWAMAASLQPVQHCWNAHAAALPAEDFCLCAQHLQLDPNDGSVTSFYFGPLVHCINFIQSFVF